MWQKTQNNNGLNQREVYPSPLSRPRREGPQLVWQSTVSRTQAPLCKAPIPGSPHGSGGLLELQAPSGKRGKHIEIHAPPFEDTCWKSHKPLLDSGQELSHMAPLAGRCALCMRRHWEISRTLCHNPSHWATGRIQCVDSWQTLRTGPARHIVSAHFT